MSGRDTVSEWEYVCNSVTEWAGWGAVWLYGCSEERDSGRERAKERKRGADIDYEGEGRREKGAGGYEPERWEAGQGSGM